MNNLTHAEEVYGYQTDSAGNLHWYGVYSGYHKMNINNNSYYVEPFTYFVEKIPGTEIEVNKDPAGNEILTISHPNYLKKLIVEMEFKDD